MEPGGRPDWIQGEEECTQPGGTLVGLGVALVLVVAIALAVWLVS